MRSRNIKRTVILVGLVMVLAVASLAVASCGKKRTTTGSQTQTSSSGQTSTQPTLDSYLRELDQQINSITDSDFNESQLSDPALGL